MISDPFALAIFDLQVALVLHIKLRVNWPFDSGKKAENRYPRWHPSWMSDRNDFSIFDLPVIPMLLTSFKSIGLWVYEKKRKVDFQGGHLGFPIGTILAIFDLQVIPMLPAKFRVNRLFSSEEEAKN